MPSPLQTAQLTINLAWALTRANGDFLDTKQGDDSRQFNLAGLDTETFNEFFAVDYAIPPSTSEDIDFTDFVNLVYEETGFTKILCIMLIVNGNSCRLRPGASNGLRWFFGRVDDSITIPDGGVVAFSEPVDGLGETVDATHRILTVSAGAGTDDLTLTALAIGSNL